MEEKVQGFEEEIDLLELLERLYKQKWLILGITALGCLLALIITLSMPKKYRAEALFELKFITFPEVSEAFKGYQKNQSPGLEVKFIAVRGTNNIIKIEAEDKSPESAKDSLNKAVNLINQSLFKEKVDKKVKEINTRLEFIQIALEEVNKKSGIIYDPAKAADLLTEKENLEQWLKKPQILYPVTEVSVSNNPVKPKPVLNISVGTVSSLFLGIFIALFKDALRERRRGKQLA
ncbi:MAG TPA: hypothetical protein DIT19_02105 [Desulfonauticus sp.]|nr:MAG: GumC protein [Desulfonauticus sp. 38_4375]HCO12005.1 hypothetical protein [Desulfonauticus sp.]